MTPPEQAKRDKLANQALAQSTKSAPASSAPSASTFEQKMHERNINHGDW